MHGSGTECATPPVGKARSQPLRVLLLADPKPTQANTLLDHVDALIRDTGHDAYCVNCRNWPAPEAINFQDFDAVVIHYSIAIIYEQYLPTSFRNRIRAFKGLKAIFIQDEYRQVNVYVDAMLDLGIHLLFTCVPQAMGTIYRRPIACGVTVVPTLHGFVPPVDVERYAVPPEDRPLDIVYRGRPVPFELGNLSQEKADIAIRVGELAVQFGLAVDLDWREEARIYGSGWLQFMSSGRATLGTESGASIVDFDGSLAEAVGRYRAANPQASYREVHDALLAEHEGNVVLNPISPRAFEAIRLRTAMILFPGYYSGILKPWRHYIPLAKDYSNFGMVAERLKDMAFLKDLTSTAYEDIVGSNRYSYGTFGREVGDSLTREYEVRGFSTVRARPAEDLHTWRRKLDERVAQIIGGPGLQSAAPPALNSTGTHLLAAEQVATQAPLATIGPLREMLRFLPAPVHSFLRRLQRQISPK